MTVLKITIKDEQVELVKNLLRDMSVSIEEEKEQHVEPVAPNSESALERIKKIQQSIGDKELFKEITDPSEWQREIRKEWDRDF